MDASRLAGLVAARCHAGQQDCDHPSRRCQPVHQLGAGQRMTPVPCPTCSVMTREARVFGTGPRAARAPRADGAVARFDVSATFRGQSASFMVYYDDSLGAATGAALADGVLARCDADYQAIYQIFGSVTPPLPMTCVILNEADGAYHYGCLDNVLYV